MDVDQSFLRRRAPTYLHQGVRVGGVVVGLQCIVYLTMLSAFFLLSAMLALTTANYDDDFWEHFDMSVDPAVIAGSIFLILGVLTATVTAVTCCIGYREYNKYRNTSPTQPGAPGATTFTPPHVQGGVHGPPSSFPYSGPAGYTTVPQGPLPYSTHPSQYTPGQDPYPSAVSGQFGYTGQPGYTGQQYGYAGQPQYGEQPPPYSPYYADGGGYSAVASFPAQEVPSPISVAQAPTPVIEKKGEEPSTQATAPMGQ